MQNIIIRNATIDDIEKIADIKIEGWQTAYRGIVEDNYLLKTKHRKEIKKEIKTDFNLIKIKYMVKHSSST